jgi:hypothetical protein
MKMAGSNPGHFFELLVLTRFLPQMSPRNLRKLDCYANRYPLRSKTLSGAKLPRRHAGIANGCSVPVIGTAAAAENLHLRKRGPERQVTPPKIDRVT